MPVPWEIVLCQNEQMHEIRIDVTYIHTSPGLTGARLIIEWIREVNDAIQTQVLLLREPRANRSQRRIANPLGHDGPWVTELNVHIVCATKMGSFKLDSQSSAPKLTRKYCQSLR